MKPLLPPPGRSRRLVAVWHPFSCPARRSQGVRPQALRPFRHPLPASGVILVLNKRSARCEEPWN